jgi:hypothetical protein
MTNEIKNNWTVSVYDFSGKKVYAKTGMGDATTLDMGNAATGVYFCKTIVEGAALVNAIVVK